MNRYGVVGVVEAVLLIALFAIILATIQLTYIPELMKNREAEHMDLISNQFSQLKMAIDMLCMSKSNYSLTVPITLGSREIPYFITARAIGEISVRDDSFKISIETASGYTNLSLGTIKYMANNVYYAKQSYILECGAVVLRQNYRDDTMISPPNFVFKESGSTIGIDILAVDIESYANRSGTAGVDVTYIRANYSSMTSMDFTGVNKLVIHTEHTDPWFRFLNYSIENAKIEQEDGKVIVEPEDGYNLDIHLDLAKIYVQIGMGWIGETQKGA